MQGKKGAMFYLSALVAIIGAVSYQYFVKRVPGTLNPIVSVISIYVGVLILSFMMLLLFPIKEELAQQIRQLTWIQIAVAVSVFLMEVGFLLMYRYGWNLSTGNLVTSVVINLVLAGIGVAFLGERLNLTNAVGIVVCLLGVALVRHGA
jgi:drug/metabolite transporter (DMT)-like permease